MVDRGGIEFEVARVEEDAFGSVEGDGGGVGDGMADPDQLELERSVLAPLPEGHGMELGIDPHLLDTAPGELDREAGAVDRHLDVAEEVGESPHVVLVAVSEDDEVDVVTTFDQPGPVRKHEVYAQHVFFGEHETAVDQTDAAVDLDGGAVAADFAQAAQEGDRDAHADRLVTGWWVGGFTGWWVGVFTGSLVPFGAQVGGRRSPMAARIRWTVAGSAGVRGSRGSPTGS